MDLKDEVFEEFSENTPPMYENKPIKLPLPDEDFDENGRVKPLRKRMVKKLLRQEMKFYMPTMIFLTSCLLGVGFIFSLLLRFILYGPALEDNTILWIFIPALILYVYGIIGGSWFGVVYPITRYNKNFFKGEGYLTFSLPASAEEHIFAKRIAAILCQVIMTLAIIVSLLILFLIIGEDEIWSGIGMICKTIGELYTLEPVHAILFTVEALVFMVVGTCVGPCIFGAVSCFLSKQTEKKKIATTVVIVLIGTTIVQTAITMLTQTVFLPLLDSAVGIHIAIWLYLLVNAAVTVLCVLYEIKFLKKKLDLK